MRTYPRQERVEAAVDAGLAAQAAHAIASGRGTAWDGGAPAKADGRPTGRRPPCDWPTPDAAS